MLYYSEQQLLDNEANVLHCIAFLMNLHCSLTFMMGNDAFIISVNGGSVVNREQLMMLVGLRKPSKHLGKPVEMLHTLCYTYQCANEAGSS